MTRRNDSHHDKAEQLDQALDALMRGDQSGLDGLSQEMAETIFRLFWLSQDAGGEDSPSQYDVAPELGGKDDTAVPVTRVTGNPKRVAPISARTRKETGSLAPKGEPDTPGRPKSQPMIMRIAAIILVLIVAGVVVYSAVPLLGGLDQQESDSGALPADSLNLQQLLPERCTPEPMGRDQALAYLRDVDVERDEALRREILLAPVDDVDVNGGGLEHTFVTWQACRMFGYTYEAMSLQAPYFLREDFYGETQLDFRGPIETSYSDSTLNAMLDRREELDATSQRYWETAGYAPGPDSTLVLGGETFADEDRSFVAVRAMKFDVNSDSWQNTTTIVVFQLVDGEYRLFDIQSTPVGTPPYL